MPDLIIYHLTFPRGLHVGHGVESLEDTLDYVPSDTLFAALLDTWVHLGHQVSELLPQGGAPAFKVTSAFPFAGGVRFCPKPVDLTALFSEQTLKGESAGKRLKKIRYLSEKLLKKAAGGEYLDAYLFPEDEYEDPHNGIALQEGALWMLKEEVQDLPEAWRLPANERWTLRRKRVFSIQTAPRVTVDRINSASNLFQSERVMFSDSCGLWFGVAQNSSLRQETLDELLTVLSDAGLGGERTAGYGHFTWQSAGVLSLSEPQSRAYLLSRWHPREDEVALLKAADSAYKLETVEGWLKTPARVAAQRRRRVWMVVEGSLIADKPQGDMADVQPIYNAAPDATFPHPIYRSGFAVAMDWKPKC